MKTLRKCFFALSFLVNYVAGDICYGDSRKTGCYCDASGGESYRGRINVTEDGEDCILWFESTDFWEGDENFCRNPGGYRERPWCYIDRIGGWRYCNVPTGCGCEDFDASRCGCDNVSKSNYRGTTNRTKSGKLCQRWSSQTPNTHNFIPEEHPDTGLDNNYCRNPSMSSGGPWCYIAEGAGGWEYCDIPSCDGLSPTTSTTTTTTTITTTSTTTKTEVDPGPSKTCLSLQPGKCQCAESKGVEYTGTYSTTKEYISCLSWQDGPFYTEQEGNYCRNPFGEYRGVWCFTNRFGRWDYCNLPWCGCANQTNNKVCGCTSWKMSDYRGRINVSAKGNECLDWKDPSIPFKWSSRDPTNIDEGLEGNYCRNPKDGWDRAYCFVATGSDGEYQECDVQRCETMFDQKCPGKMDYICGCEYGKGLNYKGDLNVTKAGDSCINWNFEGSAAPNEEKNYCRNPEVSKGDWPWCYTSTSKSWGYCSVPVCGCENYDKTKCGCSDVKGADYRGQTNRTMDSRLCQKWDDQYPNKHTYLPEQAQYRDQFLELNYCRNPDMSGSRPWCYLADEAGWGYCNVPSC